MKALILRMMLACAGGTGLFATPAMAREFAVADVPQLRAAIDAAKPGDKIILEPGRYATSLHFGRKNSGTAIAPITVMAREGNGAAIIDSTATNKDVAVKFSAAAYVTITGLDITGGKYHGVFFTDGAHHITVTRNRVYDNFKTLPMNGHAELKGSMLNGNRPHHIFITQNEIFHTSHPPGGNFQGIDCNRCDDFLIADNYLHDIRQPTLEPTSHYDRGSCIQMKSGSTGTIIERNRIARCHIGIVYGGEGRISPEHIAGMVRNNLIYDSEEIGIAIVNAMDGAVLNNTLHGNAEAIRVAPDKRHPDGYSVALIANNILDHPINLLSQRDRVTQQANYVLSPQEAPSVFMDIARFDFRLKADAQQLIGKGILLEAKVREDFSGTPRPQGTGFDIGAFEYRP